MKRITTIILMLISFISFAQTEALYMNLDFNKQILDTLNNTEFFFKKESYFGGTSYTNGKDGTDSSGLAVGDFGFVSPNFMNESTGDFTISFWANYRENPTHGAYQATIHRGEFNEYFTNIDSSKTDFLIGFNTINDSPKVILANNDSIHYMSDSIKTNIWNNEIDWKHFCFTYNNGYWTSFINGTKYTEVFSPLKANHDTIWFQPTYSSDSPIDEFKLYNKGLDENEVNNIYQGLITSYENIMNNYNRPFTQKNNTLTFLESIKHIQIFDSKGIIHFEGHTIDYNLPSANTIYFIKTLHQNGKIEINKIQKSW